MPRPVDIEQLYRALLEAGYVEAAAVLQSDIEKQRLDNEEEEADVIDLATARSRQSHDWDEPDAA